LIRIKVNSKGTHAVLTVEDNGTGIAEEIIDHLGKQPMGEDTEERNMHTGTGIGVYNVNQRLISLFGSDAKLHIANRKDGRSGTRITFEVPYV
jgi:two-component system sensor histidine kinase LytS